MNALKRLFSRLPPRAVSFLAAAFSLLAGLAVALMRDYLLYRAGLPGKPFMHMHAVRATSRKPTLTHMANCASSFNSNEEVPWFGLRGHTAQKWS